MPYSWYSNQEGPSSTLSTAHLKLVSYPPTHITSKQDCFLTLKDHKPNFSNNPKCRLINPTKANLGRVAKQKLQKIVENVKKKTKLMQWKNTSAVIGWFENLSNPNKKLTFIEFDIVDYYPSITKELFDKAIN